MREELDCRHCELVGLGVAGIQRDNELSKRENVAVEEKLKRPVNSLTVILQDPSLVGSEVERSEGGWPKRWKELEKYGSSWKKKPLEVGKDRTMLFCP